MLGVFTPIAYVGLLSGSTATDLSSYLEPGYVVRVVPTVSGPTGVTFSSSSTVPGACDFVPAATVNYFDVPDGKTWIGCPSGGAPGGGGAYVTVGVLR